MSRIRNFLHFLAACAGTALAGLTAPGDQYILYLNKSPEAKWAYGLCFADSSVYFHDKADSARKFIALADVRRIDRDTRRDALRGAAIGIGLAVGGTVANYYLGGGNAPGVMWDRKEGHVLAGMGLVAMGSLFGSFIGEVLGREVLYESEEPGFHARQRKGYACGEMPRVDTVPPPGTAVPEAGPDSATRFFGPGSEDSPIRLGERGLNRQPLRTGGRGAGQEPPRFRNDLDTPSPAGYRDLKPQIDSQYREDSTYFQGVRKHRILVSSGAGIDGFGMGYSVREYFRISGTRMLFAKHEGLVSVTAGFSRTSTVEEVGSRYALELMAGSETPLGHGWWGHTQGGMRFLYPAEFFGTDIPLPLPTIVLNMGVSWKWRRWLVRGEGFMDLMAFVALRTGVGFEL